MDTIDMATSDDSKVEEGSVISALVEHVKDNGIYLDGDGQKGFINLTEMTWDPGRVDPHRYASAGQTIQVKVYAVTKTGFYASLKALTPDSDPFRDLDVYNPGRDHTGEVTMVRPFGAFVRLASGAVGRISQPADLAVGDLVAVTIASFDVALRKVELTLVRATRRSRSDRQGQ